jgi:post-segregation antitoxin (ccd killing protein)
MNPATIAILTQPEIIALNQDPLCYQAHRLRKEGSSELWAKPLGKSDGGEVAVTLLNRSKLEVNMSFDLAEVGIDATREYSLRDLWQGKTLATVATGTSYSSKIPAHGVVVLRIKGSPLAKTPFKREF